MASEDAEKMRSSLLVQILVYFHYWFALLYLVVNIALYVYKGYYLPYPPTALEAEVIFILLNFLVEMMRLFQSKFFPLSHSLHSRGLSLPSFRMLHNFRAMLTVSIFHRTPPAVSKGNKTEQVPPLVWGGGLSIIVLILNFYMIAFQTYILRLDLVLNYVCIALVGLEVIGCLVYGVLFSQNVHH